MRNLIFFLLLLTALPASSQVVAGNYTPGFYSSVNYVKNPSCILNDANITDASGIVSRTTTSPITEGLKASCLIDGTASAQVVKFVMNSFDTDLDGDNCEAMISFKGDASKYKIYVESPVSTKITPDFQLSDTGSLSRTEKISFPCGVRSTAKVLVVETTDSAAAAIKVGNAYGGKNTSVSSTQLVYSLPAQTVTVGAVTTPPTKGATTLDTARVTRDGADAIIEIDYLQSTSGAAAGSGVYLFTLPHSLVADETKISHSVTVTNDQGDAGGYAGSGVIQRAGADNGTVSAYMYDTTRFYLKFNGGLQDSTGTTIRTDSGNAFGSTTIVTFAHNLLISLKLRVPIKGWLSQNVQSVDAVSKRGSIYFASGQASVTAGSFTTLNVAAFGTNTLEGQALAPTTANDLGIRMTGAPAAVYEVQATGWFYAHRNSAQVSTNCEFELYDGSLSRGGVVTGAAQVSGVATIGTASTLTGIFPLSSSGTINVVVRAKRSSGDGTCYSDGPVSMSIKNISQNSPAMIIPLSISTSANNGAHFNSSQVGSTGTVSKETGDWVSGSCSVASAVYTCSLVAGAFSTDPACHATIFGETTNYNAVVTSANTSTVVVRTFDTANVAAAAAFALTCSGPR